MKILFSVACVPIPQPRQRHRVRFASNGEAYAQNYTPEKDPVNTFKAIVRQAAERVHRGAFFEGPVALEVVFVMPRPKGLFWKTKPMPRAPHVVKPDLDNLVKALKDSLTGVVWRDDSQVCEETLRKQIAAGDEQPGVSVSIEELQP